MNIVVERKLKTGWIANVDFIFNTKVLKTCNSKCKHLMDISVVNQTPTSTLEKVLDCTQETIETFNLMDDEDDIWLFYQNDGQDIDAPENWKEMVIEEAKKRGWKSYYDV